MKILLSNKIRIENTPDLLSREVKHRLTIENPIWVENEKMGRWQGETPSRLRYFEQTPSGLVIPRGFLPQLIGVAKQYGEPFQIEDRRRVLSEVDFQFHGELRPFQKEAVQAMITRDMGTLSAPTGSGKTVMALYLIAQRRQPALIITHTKELLEQWAARIGQFLGISENEIGRIGDGKRTVGEKITVALVQTLYKCADEVFPHVGHLIVDECHRTPARTFTEAVSAFDCRFITGLSATPWRRDRLSKLIFWYVGNVIHEIAKKSLIETGDVLPVEVVWQDTYFVPDSNPMTEYSRMLSELTEDSARNRLIVQDVAQEASNGAGICLVLSDRKSHCEMIRFLLSKKGIQSHVLTGDLSDSDRAAHRGGLRLQRTLDFVPHDSY